MSNFENLKSLLITRWDYKPNQVDDTIKDLREMDQDLQVALFDFISKGTYLTTPAYFNLSPADISKYYPSFKPPAVFLLMDWIKKEPMAALDALVDEFHKPLPPSFDPKALFDYLEKKKNSDDIKEEA